MAVIQTLDFIRRHPLTKSGPLAAIWRYVLWQIRSRLRTDVELTWISGTRVIVRRGMTGFTGNIYCGLHEFADMGFMLHALRPGDTFIDAGANVGSYTLLASGVCGARTLSFEPDPGTAAFLRRNLKVNGLEALVEVYEMALGDDEGEISFTTGRDTTNRIASPGELATRQTSLGRLDGIAEAGKATVIKLDVEGSEGSILAGAGQVLAGDKLLAVVSEGVDNDVTGTLARAGFRRAFYDPGSRTLSETPNGLASANGLFIRNWPAVTQRIAAAPRRRVLGQTI